MGKYKEDEEFDVKWKLRKYQNRASQLREELKTEVLDEKERKNLTIILQNLEKRIHLINSNINQSGNVHKPPSDQSQPANDESIKEESQNGAV